MKEKPEDIHRRSRPWFIKSGERWEVIPRESLQGETILYGRNVKLGEDPPCHSPSYRGPRQPSTQRIGKG